MGDDFIVRKSGEDYLCYLKNGEIEEWREFHEEGDFFVVDDFSKYKFLTYGDIGISVKNLEMEKNNFLKSYSSLLLGDFSKEKYFPICVFNMPLKVFSRYEISHKDGIFHKVIEKKNEYGNLQRTLKTFDAIEKISFHKSGVLLRLVISGDSSGERRHIFLSYIGRIYINYFPTSHQEKKKKKGYEFSTELPLFPHLFVYVEKKTKNHKESYLLLKI